MSAQITIGNRPPFPTNTLHTIRLQMFQATRRPQMIEKIIETAHGKVRIKGRLGQAHLDVFEAICYSRERKKEVDERIHIFVDPWEVRKKSGQMSGTTLEKILDDLMQAIIEIIEPNHLVCVGHLVDHVDIAKNAKTDVPITKPGKFGDREMWSVEIGKAFCKLVRQDVWVGYNPAPIARIESGISQAVARHALTHREVPNGGWKMDTLIKSVAGDVTDSTLRKYRERIRDDAEKLSEIGVFVENDRITTKPDNDRDT